MERQHLQIGKHEAAHAIVHTRAGHRITRLVVRPQEGYVQVTLPFAPGDLRACVRTDPRGTHRALQDIVMALWAGPLAEGTPPCGTDGQLLTTWRAAWQGAQRTPSWVSLERHALDAIRVWLRWRGTQSCLDWLAQRLCAAQEVTGAQWYDLLRAYGERNHHTTKERSGWQTGRKPLR